VAVAADLRFSSIGAGDQHTCGLTIDGSAYCWGNNWRGQLGTDVEGSIANPVRVKTGRTFAVIKSGGEHTCAITSEREAYCWGSNWRGQLGNDFPFADPRYNAGDYMSGTPEPVLGRYEFLSMSAGGEYHTCGITIQGDAYCWGSNLFGQLGYGKLEYFPGTTLRASITPKRVVAPSF
jgi:alpha-tubulin suppressor-like RCC1 family protein